jgi:hypothetical protein
MKKRLIALLFSGFLASCSIFFPPPKPEKIVLMALSDDGVVFLKDTDSDGGWDRKFYYELIGTTEKETEFKAEKYYILKYLRSEAYSPGLDLDFPGFPRVNLDLEKSVVMKRK